MKISRAPTEGFFVRRCVIMPHMGFKGKVQVVKHHTINPGNARDAYRLMATGGVHGGNRLGDNAVADFAAFGRIAGQSAAAAL